MNKDILILADTRQQKDDYITKYFDKNNIQWIRTGLPSADYMALRYYNNNETSSCDERGIIKNKGFIKDYTTLIDTKKDVEEIVGNLCHTTEHERVKREIEKAKELGCKQFIFLICDNKIKTIDDLRNWSSKRTKVKGEILLKIMSTMAKRYGIKFMFTSKQNAGKKIIELLK